MKSTLNFIDFRKMVEKLFNIYKERGRRAATDGNVSGEASEA